MDKMSEADVAIVRQVTNEFHGMRPGARHGSFTNSLAVTHCICWGSAFAMLRRIREQEVGLTKEEAHLALEVLELPNVGHDMMLHGDQVDALRAKLTQFTEREG